MAAGWDHYLLALLERMYPSMEVSGRGMRVLCDYVQRLLRTLCAEVRRAEADERDLEAMAYTAVRRVLPAELAAAAHSEGTKAITKALLRSEKKKKNGSLTSRAGFLFPVDRAARCLRRVGYRKEDRQAAAVLLTATLQCVASELLEHSGSEAQSSGSQRLYARHIRRATRRNLELNLLLLKHIQP